MSNDLKSRPGGLRLTRGGVAAGGAAVAAVLALSLGFLASRPPAGGPDGETSTGPGMQIVTEAKAALATVPQKFDVEPEAPTVLPKDVPAGAPIPLSDRLAGLTATPQDDPALDAALPDRAPPVDEPAPARVERASFDCGRTRDSRAETMVCGDPELAAADRRLDRVFHRALDRTDDPDALAREQTRWLADRETAAEHGPEALADAYARRTDELRELN